MDVPPGKVGGVVMMVVAAGPAADLVLLAVSGGNCRIDPENMLTERETNGSKPRPKFSIKIRQKMSQK